MIALPLGVALVTLVFASMVHQQYRARRKPYQAAWAFSLYLSAAASLAYGLMALNGGSELWYRLYYLFGALMAGAYMGLGSTYLVVGRRTGNVIAWTLHVLSAVGGVLLFQAPIRPEALAAIGYGGGAGVLVPGAWLPVMILLNLYGAVAVVAVALMSVVQLRRKQADAAYVRGNWLIAIGIFIVSAAGSAARLGFEGAFWVTMAIGWIIAFGGYMTISSATAPQVSPSHSTSS